MNDAEAKMYSDIAEVVNRTDTPIEFMYDSKLYIIPANGSKHLPRFIARHGVSQNAIEYGNGGLVTKSLLGIKGDKLFVTDPIPNEEVKILLDQDRFGEEYDTDGKIGRKRKVSLKPQAQNFSGNNQ